MNQLETLPVPAIVPSEEQIISTSKPFIEANTIESSLEEMRTEHIIPVFVKDNETLISHVEFIESVQSITYDLFRGETIFHPAVRLSHPIKGRIPEAKDKQAKDLHPWEKTLYYERMAFVIEIPSIQAEIDGNTLSLSIGGVKAYNEDNLYARSNQSDQCQSGEEINIDGISDRIGRCSSIQELLDLYRMFPQFQQTLKPEYERKKRELIMTAPESELNVSTGKHSFSGNGVN